MKNTNDENFYKDVVDGNGLILVKFWADWCPPCHALTPKVGRISEEFKDDLTVFSLDIEANPKTAELYSIKSIPSLLLFKNGLIIDRMVGNVNEGDLQDFIEEGLNHVEKVSEATAETKKE